MSPFHLKPKTFWFSDNFRGASTLALKHLLNPTSPPSAGSGQALSSKRTSHKPWLARKPL